jgi:broad specificity phosphatase PhoE
MKTLIAFCLALFVQLGAAPSALAQSAVGETVLIIRHAEPNEGQGLSAAGQARAEAYAQYFKTFSYNGQPLPIGYLFSAIDSDNSFRPRLTLQPTAAALGLAIDNDYRTKQVDKVARAVRKLPAGAVALIAWRHSEIPDLLASFGADPQALLPDGRWPGKVFNWLIVLQFDAAGKLVTSQRIAVGSS